MSSHSPSSPRRHTAFDWIAKTYRSTWLAKSFRSLKRWSIILLAALGPVILLSIEINHRMSTHEWRVGTFVEVDQLGSVKSPENSEPAKHAAAAESESHVRGIIVSWYSLVTVVIILAVWLMLQLTILNKNFEGIHDRLEWAWEGQQENLATIFNVLHAHTAKSKRLEDHFKAIAAGYWKLISPKHSGESEFHSNPEHLTLDTIEMRVLKLLGDAKRTLDGCEFELVPWSFAQFEEYPRPQYERVNKSVKATNVGAVDMFFGQGRVVLDNFLKYNETAKLGTTNGGVSVPIERLFVLDENSVSDQEDSTVDSESTTKIQRLKMVMDEMLKVGVEIGYIDIERARTLLDLSESEKPDDFTIFESHCQRAYDKIKIRVAGVYDFKRYRGERVSEVAMMRIYQAIDEDLGDDHHDIPLIDDSAALIRIKELERQFATLWKEAFKFKPETGIDDLRNAVGGNHPRNPAAHGQMKSVSQNGRPPHEVALPQLPSLGPVESKHLENS